MKQKAYSVIFKETSLKQIRQFFLEGDSPIVTGIKMKLLTKEQQESYKNTKICYICKEQFENKYLKDKTGDRKVRNHCY